MAMNDIKDFFLECLWNDFLINMLATAIPVKLRGPPVGFKDSKILFFANITHRKYFRGKCLKQKLFLIKFYIKKVTCKIFVELKITLSERAGDQYSCHVLIWILMVLASIRLDTVDVV
jgi:hypothetical protein